MRYDRIYLPLHPEADAIKVGVAGRPHRVRAHHSRGYQLVAQWTGVRHTCAVAAGRAVSEPG